MIIFPEAMCSDPSLYGILGCLEVPSNFNPADRNWARRARRAAAAAAAPRAWWTRRRDADGRGMSPVAIAPSIRKTQGNSR